MKRKIAGAGFLPGPLPGILLLGLLLLLTSCAKSGVGRFGESSAPPESSGDSAPAENYTVTADTDAGPYRYAVRDNGGTVLDSQSSLRYRPEFSRVSGDILRIQTRDGRYAGCCRYYNLSGGIASEWYPVTPLADTDTLFAYVDGSKSELIVQKIFNPSADSKMFPLEGAGAAGESFTARFVNNDQAIEVTKTNSAGDQRVYSFPLKES